MLHLQLHHGVLAHLVSPGFRDVVDANQLGLIPHAVSLEPAHQVLIRLLRHWHRSNQNDVSLWRDLLSTPFACLLTLLLLFLEGHPGHGGGGGRAGGVGIGGDGCGGLHLCRHVGWVWKEWTPVVGGLAGRWRKWRGRQRALRVWGQTSGPVSAAAHCFPYRGSSAAGRKKEKCKGGREKKKKEKLTIFRGSTFDSRGSVSAAAGGSRQKLLKSASFGPAYHKQSFSLDWLNGNDFITAGKHNFDRRTKGHVNHKMPIS